MLKTFRTSLIGDSHISAIAGNLSSIEIISCENKISMSGNIPLDKIGELVNSKKQ